MRLSPSGSSLKKEGCGLLVPVNGYTGIVASKTELVNSYAHEYSDFLHVRWEIPAENPFADDVLCAIMSLTL
jgi:hypothetical protein